MIHCAFTLGLPPSWTLLSWHNPSTRWPQCPCPIAPMTPIILKHCCHHLCSSHWPLAGDGEPFCCSTCGRPAAPAQGSTDTLQIPLEPRPTQAGTGARTSPETTTTYCHHCLCCWITRRACSRWSWKSTLSSDYVQTSRRSLCSGDATEESQVLTEKKTGAACGFFILQLLLWRSKGGVGLPWQPPRWWQKGWRVWEGNLYKSNHFLGWG